MITKLEKTIRFEVTGVQKDESEKDLSAITLVGDYVLVGSDEGNHLQILKKQAHELLYTQIDTLTLDDSVEEIDIEGMAHFGNTIYVVCSCSLTRKAMKPKKRVQENRERLYTISKENERSPRCQLFRFTFDLNEGTASNLNAFNLKEILSEDPILGRFMKIPSKENGVDIEGIAVDHDTLYLGFRGPVLRGNYVPILVTTFDHPENYELRFIHMGGRGVRDMTKIEEGFLIIGGPVGDGEGSYELYFWDGTDSLPGEDQENGTQLMSLGTIPTQGAKAEGLAVINKTQGDYEVLIVYDSLVNGEPSLFRIKLP